MAEPEFNFMMMSISRRSQVWLPGGWWETENLDIVSRIFHEIAQIADIEYLGSIRRPHAYKLQEETDLNRKIKEVLESLGKRLIETEKIDSTDLDYIGQPLIDEKAYRTYLNEVHG